jgi:DNA-binding response OmpR family regulator
VRKEVLVADDDNDILKSVKDIFEHQGYMVHTVTDGFECLDKLEKGFKGILILDIAMPKLDGWDTLREIVKRGLEKNVRIFIITARGTSHQEKKQGLEPFITDYITKPFDVRDLVQNIRNPV